MLFITIKLLIFAFANISFPWLNYNLINKVGPISGIKHRKTANDVLQTPLPLALKLIEIVEIQDDDMVLDPCRGDGVIYNNLPYYCQKDWVEILENRNFFITTPPSISSFLIHRFLFITTGLFIVLN